MTVDPGVSWFDETKTTDASGKNPYAPYVIGAPHTGTYIGVPQGYQIQTGVARGGYMGPGYGMGGTALISPHYSNEYIGPGYGMGGGSIANQEPEPMPVYQRPYYTYADVEGLRGQYGDHIFEIQKALYNGHYLPDNFNAYAYDAQTETALGNAMADANRNGMTLQDWFAAIASGAVEKGKLFDAQKAGQARDVPFKSTSLTSRAGAQQVLTQALAQELGREPTDAEVTKFLHSLNAEEKTHPSVTTTHYDASGQAVSSTSVPSSVDPGAEAQSFARSGPLKAERTQYQHSLYFDLLASMMSGGGH